MKHLSVLTGNRPPPADRSAAGREARLRPRAEPVARIIELAIAMLGVFAVRWAGGSWELVAIMTAVLGITAFIIRRRSPKSRGHDRWVLARSVIAVPVVWTLVSFVSYVGHDNGDTFVQRVTTWGRDHHLGGVIDFMETRMYSAPPSKTPAKKLELAIALVPPSAQPSIASSPASASTTPPAQESSAATVSVPSTVAPIIAATTDTAVAVGPTTVTPVAPTPLNPVFSPILDGEGQWSPIARAAGQDTMWATSIRPLPSAGGVVASMVVIDQTNLRAGLFNGAEEPGGSWERGNRVPPELQPALLAAMNGGFRFEHIKGGYKTEGTTVKPLKDGDATLAVAKDGRLALGQLGRDLLDDGSWISLRQNLILIVDDGQSQVQRGVDEGVWWGADYGNEVYVPRSAVCEMADSRLAYVLVGKVNASQLAQSLINLGCVKAMQLDINGTWPVFFTFAPGGDGALTGTFLDRRMGGNPSRYITGSTKEFFAFFDSTLVPAGSVLDK